jgi:hypothetical protein
MSIPTFATLLNDRVVAPSNAEEYVGVRRHFFQDCMAWFLDRVKVDEGWYLSTYPDVRKALTDGVVPNARTHWVKFGYYEHRMPFRIEVDEPWYLTAYPDIERAVKRRDVLSGQDHFERFGYREGRLPYARFSLA